MYRIGQLGILGIQSDDFPEDVYTLLLSDDLFNRFESYREIIDRRSETLLDPDRAFTLFYNATNGTEQEKIKAATLASIAATPLPE